MVGGEATVWNMVYEENINEAFLRRVKRSSDTRRLCLFQRC